jgi:membrane protease YdiL (CAAX protease family)
MNQRRSALLMLLLVLPAPTIGNLAAVLWWPGTALGQTVFVATKIWTLALPLVWLRWVARQPLSWSPPRNGGLGLGALTGLAILAIIGGIYLLFGQQLVPTAEVREMARSTGLSSRTMYLAGAAYWICVNSVLEEYVWRWFVFARLADLVPTRWAVLGSGLGFTLHHIAAISIYLPGPTAGLATLGILVGAGVWSWLYARYGSIWPGYLSHVGADVAVFAIGYHLIFAGAS